MAAEGKDDHTTRPLLWRYSRQLVAAVSAYLLFPVVALVLVRSGWVWSGLSLGFLNLLVLLALILVFSTFPMPARPGTLHRMDFAAVSWLPHVAVTRLPEKRLEGRARGHLFWRSVLAVLLLLGGNGLVGVAVLARAGFASGAGVGACLLLLCAAFLSVAYVGRELRAAAGQIDRGTEIG